jgi:DNA-directed RNA polymerase specialized sigma24 family protein
MSDRMRARIDDNDPCLAPLLCAHTVEERDAAVERIVIDHVQPVIDRTLRGHRPEEGREIASAIHVRVLRRLQQFPGGDPIRNLADYVATVSHNTIYDDLRRRHPERTRLKNRLRYAVTHDPRLALWATTSGMTCGLAPWSGRAPLRDVDSITNDVTRAMRDQAAVGGALAAIFARAGGPLLLDDLVRVAMVVWEIADEPTLQLQDEASPVDAAARLESREAVEAVWQEIREFRQHHRVALLLNLRDPSGQNATALLVHLGIATRDEIAEQLGLTPAHLAEIWHELPLDDLTIASMLGVSRQQVINMRKAARQRLARKISPGRKSNK